MIACKTFHKLLNYYGTILCDVHNLLLVICKVVLDDYMLIVMYKHFNLTRLAFKLLRGTFGTQEGQICSSELWYCSHVDR